MSAHLYGIGAGPGDPELLTLKAVRLLQAAEVIACPADGKGNPGLAYRIIERHLPKGRAPVILDFSFEGNEADRRESRDRAGREVVAALQKDLGVAFLSLGDPLLYSTFAHVLDHVARALPNVPVSIVPGVSSIQAAAAELGTPLALGDDRVAILPGMYRHEDLRGALRNFETVVLLKTASALPQILGVLRETGCIEGASLVEWASRPECRVTRGEAIAGIGRPPYFSLLVVKRPAAKPPTRKGTAVVALTKSGAAIAARIPGATAYVLRPHAEPPAIPFDAPLEPLVARLWREHESLVFVTATGIAVRSIAPLLDDKATDPGVVVIDDAGRFAIPLTGGHLGGAEALAEDLAKRLGLTPVVTTASSAHGLPALDLLGKRFGWKLVDGSGLKAAAAALVNGEPVALVQEAGERGWGLDEAEFDAARHEALVVVSDRPQRPVAVPSVHWCPRTLAVGMGSERGTDPAAFHEALDSVLRDAGRLRESVSCLASADLKADEPGLVALAAELGVPLKTYAAEALAAKGGPNPSAEVRAAVGTPGVAEPAALLAANASELLVEKRIFKGRKGAVTAAVALIRPEGALRIVGIGPGDVAQMTGAARAALDASDAVVGYTLYLDLIRPVLRGQQLFGSPISQETERAELSLKLARDGRRVALISSGDAGIYAMAGLALERLAPGDRFPVEVLPGVSALQAAASRLGAPLMHDFASVSLSDLLTPIETIERRVRAASEADFVLALYNPRSQTRTVPFERALAILREGRDPATPVGMVRSAFRPDERVTITTLGALRPEAVDMMTVLLVGNRTTYVRDGRMITPRGKR